MKSFSPTSFTHKPLQRDARHRQRARSKKAFNGFSGGWTSSRINLSALAGKKVKFRFRLATGPNGAWDSWILDDIRVFKCS